MENKSDITSERDKIIRRAVDFTAAIAEIKHHWSLPKTENLLFSMYSEV